MVRKACGSFDTRSERKPERFVVLPVTSGGRTWSQGVTDGLSRCCLLTPPLFPNANRTHSTRPTDTQPKGWGRRHRAASVLSTTSSSRDRAERWLSQRASPRAGPSAIIRHRSVLSRHKSFRNSPGVLGAIHFARLRSRSMTGRSCRTPISQRIASNNTYVCLGPLILLSSSAKNASPIPSQLVIRLGLDTGLVFSPSSIHF